LRRRLLRKYRTPEVVDAFRRFADSYLDAHGAATPPSHRRAIADIIACRTEALRGRQWVSNKCGSLLHVFHSCRNRACPKRQDQRAMSSGARRNPHTKIFLPARDFALSSVRPTEPARSIGRATSDSLSMLYKRREMGSHRMAVAFRMLRSQPSAYMYSNCA
jgi:hypothetical protein